MNQLRNAESHMERKMNLIHKSASLGRRRRAHQLAETSVNRFGCSKAGHSKAE
jgi:hypothetical protein